MKAVLTHTSNASSFLRPRTLGYREPTYILRDFLRLLACLPLLGLYLIVSANVMLRVEYLCESAVLEGSKEHLLKFGTCEKE